MKPTRFFYLLLLCALSAGAAEKPAATHEGFDGWWLANETAEVFVIAEPYPRLVAFRLKEGDSPLHVSHEYEYFGVHAWFLEPEQNAQSGLPALQPAVAERTGSRSLRLTSVPEEESGMQLITEVALDGKEPLVRLRHGFKNLRSETRRVAAWALNVIDPDGGVGVTRWRADRGRRLFLFWPATSPDEPSLHLGSRALAVDYRILPLGRWCKVGTNTDAGWVAYVWDGSALKSSVAHVPDAEYPEDGGTITFFNSKRETFEGKPRFGEIENLGPLTDLAPGDTLWLDQQLEIIGGLEGDDPEGWVDILEAE